MALAVDRALLFTGGSHANAEDLVVQSELPQPNTVVDQPETRSPADLAHRLRSFCIDAGSSPETIPDAFATPDQWFSVVPVSYVDSHRTPTSVLYELSAVVNTSDGGFAVVDGRPVKVGQTRRGVTLISIGDREAEIEVNGVRYQLRIASPVLDR